MPPPPGGFNGQQGGPPGMMDGNGFRNGGPMNGMNGGMPPPPPGFNGQQGGPPGMMDGNGFRNGGPMNGMNGIPPPPPPGGFNGQQGYPAGMVDANGLPMDPRLRAHEQMKQQVRQRSNAYLQRMDTLPNLSEDAKSTMRADIEELYKVEAGMFNDHNESYRNLRIT